MIDEATVIKMAELARIEVTAEELGFYREGLSRILSLCQEMQTVNTEGVEPMLHALELQQPLRADVVTETDAREQLLSLAPKTLSGLYLVPKVIE